MFRLMFRFMGWLALAGGFVTIVINGTQSIAADAVIFTPFGQTAQKVLGKSFNGIEPALLQSRTPFVWDPVLTHVFAAPTFAILLVVGSALILMTGKRSRQIGYSSRP